jgi:hypothetical protein
LYAACPAPRARTGALGPARGHLAAPRPLPPLALALALALSLSLSRYPAGSLRRHLRARLSAGAPAQTSAPCVGIFAPASALARLHKRRLLRDVCALQQLLPPHLPAALGAGCRPAREETLQALPRAQLRVPALAEPRRARRRQADHALPLHRAALCPCAKLSLLT